MAHPSLLAVPEEVEAIARPFSVANGPEDGWLSAAKTRMLADVLGKKDCEVAHYEGARHGFAVRGDTATPGRSSWHTERRTRPWRGSGNTSLGASLHKYLHTYAFCWFGDLSAARPLSMGPRSSFNWPKPN